MRKMLSMAALMLSVMLVASSSYAETTDYSMKYTGGGPVVGLTYALGDPDLGDIGGVRFVGTEGEPTSVKISDASGGPVRFNAAQDLDGDIQAGEAGEPTVSGCARPGEAAALSGSLVPFQEGFDIVIFVYTASASAATCRGGATQGTVTLTTTTA